MSHSRSFRRRLEQARPALTTATAATAIAAGLTVGAPSASAADCTVPTTEITEGLYEVRFTDTTGCDWAIPADATQLEALLVGSGGGSVWGYAGGGGEVLLVDLTGSTGALSITVGTSSVGTGFSDRPARDAVDTVVTDGVTTHTARGGYFATTDEGAVCAGASGNGNAGWCDYSRNDGGGGAGGAAPGTPEVYDYPGPGDGGPGVVVADIAAIDSLFAGVDDCYGGGGASARIDYSTAPILTNYAPNTPGCGGGYVSASETGIDVSLVTFEHELEANTGGGAAAGPLASLTNAGSDGLVVVRYQLPVTPDTTATPTTEDDGSGAAIPETGSDSSLPGVLGAALVAGGAALAVAARRSRPTA